MNTNTDNQIITSADLQVAYMKLYSEMMKRLWNVNTVMHLANLEISIYKRFPDKEEMAKYMGLLESDIKDTFNTPDDPDAKSLKKKFELLSSKIDDFSSDTGYDIYSVTSNKDIPDIGESEESEEIEEVEESVGPKKKKIKIADITITPVTESEE